MVQSARFTYNITARTAAENEGISDDGFDVTFFPQMLVIIRGDELSRCFSCCWHEERSFHRAMSSFEFAHTSVRLFITMEDSKDGHELQDKSRFLNVAAFLYCMKRKLWIGGGILLAVTILSVFISMYTSTTIAPSTLSQEYDVIIVPGQGVTNGILLKDAPQRLDYALKVFSGQEVKPTIIVSGYGRGYVPRNTSEIEAHLMYEYLAPRIEQQGFDPQNVIVVENQSHHTVENVLFSQKLIPQDAKSVLVLAAPKAHYRTKLLFTFVLKKHDVMVYSLREQIFQEKKNDIFRTIGALFILSLPGEETKLWTSQFLFLNIVGEQCSEATWIQKAFCVG